MPLFLRNEGSLREWSLLQSGFLIKSLNCSKLITSRRFIVVGRFEYSHKLNVYD
jgi:hypothetical protein